MNTAEYILDPRYETIMLAVKELTVGADPTAYIIHGPAVPKFLAGIDPKVTVAVTFNAKFDMSIFAWRYGWVPAQMLDVMDMARALRGHVLKSASLRAVLDLLRQTNPKVPHKGDEVQLTKGRRYADLCHDPIVWPSVCRYAKNDVEGTAIAFDMLSPEWPRSERRVMDRVLRACVEPRLYVDTALLEQHIKDIRKAKSDALIACEQDKSTLMSTNKFQRALESLGVAVEFKQSQTGKTIPAFAKTDDFMNELLEHENPKVAALVAARLGVRSTIEETRSETFLRVANLPWPSSTGVTAAVTRRPLLPVPLKYGPHTWRFAGDWKMNLQNLPKGSKLRKAIIPPPGCKVLVADLRQIEARVTAWICNQTDLLRQFAGDLDPYSILARKIFNVPDNETVTKVQRFVGKTGVLGLGFGCGPDKFYTMVLKLARTMGEPMPEGFWTPELARKAVNDYRSANTNIRASWQSLDGLLWLPWGNTLGGSRTWGGPRGNAVTISYGCVTAPNGLKMRYDVTPGAPAGDRLYKYGGITYKLYGSKLLENIVQFLARIIFENTAMRLWDRGYEFVIQAHDEIVIIVPEENVEQATRDVLEEMRRRPSWAPELPVDAEVSVGDSYGDAK